MSHSSSLASKSVLLEIKDITKAFGATRALRGVSLNVKAGETLGLLGANGAGKSTLIKILSANYSATSGEIFVEGERKTFAFPDDAREAGIETVHQNIDDGVVFGMSVAENLLLEEIAASGSSIFVNQNAIMKRARHIEDQLELDLPLAAPIEDLSASGRQEVLIARALVKNPKLLILDEPTSTLSERESEKLFEAVKDLKRRGIAILYISHRMSEIELLCDRAVVLRNGLIVSEHDTPLDTKAIASSILGELVLNSGHECRDGSDVAFEATGLRATPDSAPIDLTLRRGEVIGLTGLIGAGKTELLEQICGHRKLISGDMALNDAPYAPRDAADAMSNGVVMVPEQRALQSIFPGETLWNHCTIGLMGLFTRFGIMNPRREIAFTRDVIDSFRVVCPGAEAEIEELSGGNQQKLLVGRWMEQDWKLFVLDEPFRGIDIGARGAISAALREYAKRAPVIVCSSDPEEVIEVADRVLIMVEGRILHEDKASNVSPESLSDIMSQTGLSDSERQMETLH